MLPIALSGQVLRWNSELLRQHKGNRLGATVRQREIIDVGADSVGMAFNQEDLLRISRDRAVEPVRNRRK